MGVDGHNISIQGRKWVEVTGVSSVESCDVSEITLTTQGGPLQLTGNNMHMKQLDLEHGVVAVEGTIISLAYVTDKKRKTNLLKRAFR